MAPNIKGDGPAAPPFRAVVAGGGVPFRPGSDLALWSSWTLGCRFLLMPSRRPPGCPRSSAARTCWRRCWAARARRARVGAVRFSPPACGTSWGSGPGCAQVAERILDHVRRGSQITVHGDYDVDGVCSTAILVRALRTVGAQVDWYLPSRIDDGYGLAAATVEKLAARGTNLLITVDCAVTAVEEVAAAKALGMDVVVTDHHSPRADGRAAGRADRAPAPQRLPVPRAVRGGRRVQARPGAARRDRAGPGAVRRGPGPGGAGDGRRRRAAAGREPPPRA